MRVATLFGLGCLSLAALPGICRADTATEALLGHRQAREAIFSIRARYTCKTFDATGSQVVERDGEWWQRGDMIRWKESSTKQTKPRKAADFNNVELVTR